MKVVDWCFDVVERFLSHASARAATRFLRNWQQFQPRAHLVSPLQDPRRGAGILQQRLLLPTEQGSLHPGGRRPPRTGALGASGMARLRLDGRPDRGPHSIGVTSLRGAGRGGMVCHSQRVRVLSRECGAILLIRGSAGEHRSARRHLQCTVPFP